MTAPARVTHSRSSSLPSHRPRLGHLPTGLGAASPPEARGLRRDEVRLLVASTAGTRHARFTDLPSHLEEGDLVVVNTSATMPAAVDATHHGAPVVVHVSSPGDGDTWVVELRHDDQSGPVLDAERGDVVALPGGSRLRLLGPDAGETRPDGVRLWRARSDGDLLRHLRRHGRPIRYGYVPDEWPLADHQTMFATSDAGSFTSAEMPSAGRPFTREVVAGLRRRRIDMAAVTLHTGVSSLETHEPPRPERFEMPAATADAVNQARGRGSRVIAVGTTVTRAIETAVDNGTVRPASGWTDLVLGPHRPAEVVDGLITGWHPPEASHIQLLKAVAGDELVDRAYAEAARSNYLWHEFGDSCLLLPGPPCVRTWMV